MADLYVDSSLSAFTSTYNKADRQPTGGGDDAYPTLAAAYTAASAGSDTVICRVGEVGVLSSGFAHNKNVPVIRYRDEVPFLTVDTGDFNAVTITNGAEWDIAIRGGGPASPSDSFRGIFINIASATVGIDVADYTGQPFRYSTAGAGPMTITRCVTVRCSRAGIFSNSNASDVINVNGMFSKDCSATSGSGIVNFNDGTITVNDPIFIGGGTPTNGQGSVKVSSNAVLVMNNPLFVGTGEDGNTNFPLINDSSSCTINGGVINGNIFNPLVTVFDPNTAITFNGTLFNEFRVPPQSPTFPRKMSFLAEDSSHTSDGGAAPGFIGLDAWAGAFGAVNAPFTYCPDDQGQLTSAQFTIINNFLQTTAGELGEKNESSTLLSNEFPLRATYSGTDNTVAIVVDTDSAMTVVVLSDFGGANNVELSIDLTSTIAIGNENKVGAFVFDDIDGLVFSGTTLALENNSNDGFADGNQWDDAQSRALATGTYLVNSTVTPVKIPMDKAKWYQADIIEPREILLGEMDLLSMETFYSQGAEDPGTNALNFLLANGFKSIYGGQDGNASVFSLIETPFSITRKNLGVQGEPVKVRGDAVQSGIGLTAYADGLSTNGENFRQWARNICSYCATYGAYPTIKLARKLDTVANGVPGDYVWADSDVADLVSEFRVCGYDVLTTADATAALSLASGGGGGGGGFRLGLG